MRDYDEALAWIHAAPRFSSAATLRRIRALTERLRPEIGKIAFLHLAGTNGKGSTAAMLESILRAAGHRVGLFTSPYLTDFCERMQVNLGNISRADLTRLADRVRAAVEACATEGMEDPNEFEVVTAIALCWFAEQDCDYVVWETGLGGAKDATNVIPPPRAAVITSISLDHMAQLGNTVSAIAGEKAGIIKPGTGFAVAAANPPEALEVIRTRCRETGTELTVCEGPFKAEISSKGTRFVRGNAEYFVPLLGTFQRENAETAITVAEKLDIPDESIRRGLAAVSWPGRMELISRHPAVLLDSAHNEGGFRSLLESVKCLFPEKKPVALTCMMRDKAYDVCLWRATPWRRSWGRRAARSSPPVRCAPRWTGLCENSGRTSCCSSAAAYIWRGRPAVF